MKGEVGVKGVVGVKGEVDVKREVFVCDMKGWLLIRTKIFDW